MTITERPARVTGPEANEPVNNRPAAVVSIAHERNIRIGIRAVVVDLVCLAAAWIPALAVGHRNDRTVWQNWFLVGCAIALSYWQLHSKELYLARVAMVRTIELSRLFQATLMAFGGMLIIRSVKFGTDLRIFELMIGTSVSFVLLVVARSAFRIWLANMRRTGQMVREILIIGTNAEASDLIDLIADHPEAGYRVAGVVGNRADALEYQMNHLWRGEATDALAVIRGSSVNGVVMVISALESDVVNDLVRELQAKDIHIHLSNGLRGINFRRLRAAPIVHEPLFYVERSEMRRTQMLAKRALDISVAGLAVLLLSPILIGISLAIKLSDRGPVFFRQKRVGRDGRLFMVLKFRSMVIDAEARLRELQEQNERTGPLFKMDRDPRVTRLGHFLRETSLDELPQLFNVLKGEMSLVGPRPALPAEAENFDQRLLDRTMVLPGITGLWQVEARDNPSFSAYRRLDLYYVDNWSIHLDLIILFATAEQLAAKVFHMLWYRGGGDPVEAEQPEATVEPTAA